MKNKIKKVLIEFYLEWENSYLTINEKAKIHNMSIAECTALLEIGDKYFQEDFSKRILNKHTFKKSTV